MPGVLSLPADFDRVRLTGRWVLLDGTPASGTVTLAPSAARLVSPRHGTVIMGTPVVIALDADGAMAADVPATDDPDIAGGPWAYTVTVTIAGASSYTFSLSVPVGSAPIDLSAMSPPPLPPPVPDDPIVWSVNGRTGHVGVDAAGIGALPADQVGVPGGVAGLDASGVVPAAQLPDVVGEPGPQGPPGPDGPSAYQVAVSQGYTGTVEEWLASLVGPAGEQGPAGEPGPQGPTGPAGADGEPGPSGEQGPEGPAGPAGARGPAGAPGDTSWTWTAPHAGATPAGAATHRHYNTAGAVRTLTRAHASVATPGAAAITVEIRHGATAIGTVTIPAGGHTGTATLSTPLADGEYVTVAVTQGDAAAQALTVTLRVG